MELALQQIPGSYWDKSSGGELESAYKECGLIILMPAIDLKSDSFLEITVRL